MLVPCLRLTLVLVIGIGGPLATPPSAQAVVIAADAFLFGDPANPAAGEYTATPLGDGRLHPPGGLPAQNPSIPGFNDEWTGIGTSLWQAVTDGLDHPSIGGEAGGAARFTFDSEVGRRDINRPLTSPPIVDPDPGATVFLSGLVQVDEIDPNGLAWAGFSADNGDDGGTQGIRFGVVGNGSTSTMDLVLRHRVDTDMSPGAQLPSISLVNETVGTTEAGVANLFVVKVEANVVNPVLTGNDRVSVWVNPTDVSSETALGTPTAMFEDFSWFNSEAFQLMVLEGADVTGAGIRFDELNLGTTLGDVVQPARVIPEPASLAILGLAALSLAGVRRRKADTPA